MAIRLSGAQVTRIQEFLNRYEESGNNRSANLFGPRIPRHLAVETLVEDILREVTPPPLYLVKENGEICLIQNEHQIPKEQRSVSI